MDRAEFIREIMLLYPDVFKKERKEQYQGWINRYRNAINETWNFDKLMFYFDTQYKSTVVPPPPSFFYEYRNEVRVEKSKPQKIQLTPDEQKASDEAREKFFKMFRENMKGA